MRNAGRWCAVTMAVVVLGGCEAIEVEDVGPLLDELEAVQAQVRVVVDSELLGIAEALPAAQERAQRTNAEWAREFAGGSAERAEELLGIRGEASREVSRLVRREAELKRTETALGGRHGNLVRRLRGAYQDGTWDLIADASPRSIVMGALRDAEEELRRVEAGCSPLPQPGGDDCDVEAAGDQ